jgi:glycine cleavage system regulatory protein
VVQEKAGIIDRQTLLLQRQQEALEQLQSKVRALEQRAGAER